ncbi:MAG: ABC transporter ATP-binding protein [Chloroflexi bacterium]|nr:ABC transporter ATP-binding protein [Chloroflexota bacterium]
MPEPLLLAEQLTKSFTAPETPLEALAEASLELQPNEFVSIIGPSGCGKSTLLRILAGLVRPTSGRVLFEGQPLTGPQRSIALVFQHPNLMPWRSALRNVMLPLEVAGAPRLEAEARAREMLALVGLSEFVDSLPRDLSGGMAQRVALARGLVGQPDLLLLDEPFGALDALTRERLNGELLQLWQARRVTVLMVTHSIQEALYLSDRVLTMSPRPGRITQDVRVELARPRTQETLYLPRFAELTRLLRDSLH